MHKRLSLLVAAGFALLLCLGVFVIVSTISGLKETVTRSQASQASALNLRASVRSLRADYLEMGDAVSRFILDPSGNEDHILKLRADLNAKQHLAAAAGATQRADLQALLAELKVQDETVTNPVEDELLRLAATDRATAEHAYLTRYLTARSANMQLVDRALQVASEEVADATRESEARAARTIALAWRALVLFLIVGFVSAVGLTRAVGQIARDFEDAAAKVAGARDAALQATRLKSEFLANVSHEIRTPMNVIIGYTDLTLDSQIDATQRDWLERARGAALGLLDILNDVLDVAKVEAGRLSIERVPFDLRTVLSEVVPPLAVRARAKGLDLTADVGMNVPTEVLGDPQRLRQILFNLVGNAIKFTSAGQVVVRVTRDVSTLGATAMLHFAVIDTGVGIPADKQDLIFQPFVQADGTMARRYEGTGLGLTIAAQLVELMGGRIWVESEVGRGSTFHFTVPLEQQRRGLAA